MTPLANGHAPETSRLPWWQIVNEIPDARTNAERIAALPPSEMEAIVARWKRGWGAERRKEKG